MYAQPQLFDLPTAAEERLLEAEREYRHRCSHVVIRGTCGHQTQVSGINIARITEHAQYLRRMLCRDCCDLRTNERLGMERAAAR